MQGGGVGGTENCQTKREAALEVWEEDAKVSRMEEALWAVCWGGALGRAERGRKREEGQGEGEWEKVERGGQKLRERKKLRSEKREEERKKREEEGEEYKKKSKRGSYAEGKCKKERGMERKKE